MLHKKYWILLGTLSLVAPFYFACSAEPETFDNELIDEAEGKGDSKKGGQSLNELFPEYDQLAADKKISVGIVFSMANSDEEDVEQDVGIRQWQELIDGAGGLIKNGFESVDGNRQFQREVNGLTEIVDVYPPQNNVSMSSIIRGHEIILYLGHSFHGSLSYFNESYSYPRDTYQIFFVNSCWSAKYYMPQILAQKSSINTDDPKGSKYADIIATSEMTNFYTQANRAMTLLTSLFAGVETGGASYSWGKIINNLNSWTSIKGSHLPSYGTNYMVYGALDNQYTPDGGSNPALEGSIQFTSSTEVDIPDANRDGITNDIVIDQSIVPKNIRVMVDITHDKSVFDLKISLLRNNKEYILKREVFGKPGPVFELNAYQELLKEDAAGTWSLKVADIMPGNKGRLNNWTIEIVPQQ